MVQRAGERDAPSVGTALWLLAGGSMAERVAWVVENGFEGVSLLQTVMDADPGERGEAAAAISEAGLYVTYHGNVSRRLADAGMPDPARVDRMIDDVLWWHENTGGVSCCCGDPLYVEDAGGRRVFDFGLNVRHLERMAARLEPRGVRVGIENGFGGGDAFCSPDHLGRLVRMCTSFRPGILFDAGHAHVHVCTDRGADGGIGAYVTAIPCEILDVHLSDNGGAEDEHGELGSGTLDLEAVCRALNAHGGFPGRVTLEVCADILAGRYALDIRDAAQGERLVRSRDVFLAAWRRARRNGKGA